MGILSYSWRFFCTHWVNVNPPVSSNRRHVASNTNCTSSAGIRICSEHLPNITSLLTNFCELWAGCNHTLLDIHHLLESFFFYNHRIMCYFELFFLRQWWKFIIRTPLQGLQALTIVDVPHFQASIASTCDEPANTRTHCSEISMCCKKSEWLHVPPALVVKHHACDGRQMRAAKLEHLASSVEIPDFHHLKPETASTSAPGFMQTRCVFTKSDSRIPQCSWQLDETPHCSRSTLQAHYVKQSNDCKAVAWQRDMRKNKTVICDMKIQVCTFGF